MQWISVKDRLPEQRVAVLCFQNIEFKLAEQLILCRIGEFFYCINEDAEIDITGYYSGITHWMPLPSPPKTETK